jgi:hypothetical protein
MPAAGYKNSAAVIARRAPVGQRGDLRRGTDQVRLLDRLPEERADVQREDREQHHRVHDRERAFDRDQERVQRREEEILELSRLRGQQLDLALPAARFGPHDEDERRPADADEEPVRARHVRRRVADVGRVACRFPGEIQVDRVLGQHRDDRQDGDREAARDLELGELGRPRQQKCRREDRRAGCQRLHPGERWTPSARSTSHWATSSVVERSESNGTDIEQTSAK